MSDAKETVGKKDAPPEKIRLEYTNLRRMPSSR
jgi:hypothetical protein